ncbi:hypothetical protein CTA2_11805 [Colletotrichum tanaceti]|uniref:Lysine-specific metallo-endopeptidase domain-containing protein n=1 Tax=Colletotrichum tanaceti TaxID=1306861 RepID=A0A4U6XJV4_9PEZI|nr:hypothetical protein CTA2_11805 [Colletotrichum tanaceti]TKW55762.1 hypothetical protein CTA1_184 [Colletotrichum tanaceti]
MAAQRHVILALLTFLVQANALEINVVGGKTGLESDFYCSRSEVSRIDDDIYWMQALSASAYNFLDKKDSETTAAYVAWFGADNAYRTRAESIMTDVYDSIWSLGSKSTAYVADLDSSSDAIVIGCADTHTEPLCRTSKAVASDANGYILLCPRYFSGANTDYSTAFTYWRSSRTHYITGAEVLLHEMTHLSDVVGSWKTTDHAYEENQCLILDDDELIENADNFMFFALEVRANRDNAAKQVDMDASERAYKIARRLLTEGSATGSTSGVTYGSTGGWNYYQSGYPYWRGPWCYT